MNRRLFPPLSSDTWNKLLLYYRYRSRIVYNNRMGFGDHSGFHFYKIPTYYIKIPRIMSFLFTIYIWHEITNSYLHDYHRSLCQRLQYFKQEVSNLSGYGNPWATYIMITFGRHRNEVLRLCKKASYSSAAISRSTGVLIRLKSWLKTGRKYAALYEHFVFVKAASDLEPT